MKKILLCILLGGMIGFLLDGCIDDETTGFKTEGSPITITTSDTIYYKDFGFPITITPEISQLQAELPLKYEWKAIALDGGIGSDSLRVIGTEKDLNYKFSRSGEYRVRLRVENQYGSSFRYFRVFVQAPFEKGILVLSSDTEDKGRLSFLRLKNEGEALDKTGKDFNTQAFSQVNPDRELRGIRDVVLTKAGKAIGSQISRALAVSSETEGVIYFINTQDFLIQNVVDIKQNWPEARPTTLFSSEYNGISKLLFATHDAQGNNGDFGILKLESYIAYPDGEVCPEKNAYDKTFFGQYIIEGWEGSVNYVACFIDNEASIVHICENGNTAFSSGNTFFGQYILNIVSMPVGGSAIIVTIDKADPLKVRVYKTLDVSRWDWDNKELLYKDGGYEYVANSEVTLTPECVMCMNDKYQHAYYFQGNKLYRWVYNAIEPKLPVDADFTLPDPKDEITCVALSPDQQHLYVCVYNPDAKTELKGKLLIINANKMTVENTYEGISDKAIKVMWKEAM